MRRRCALLLLVAAAPAHAAFQDPLWTARAAALGGAFTALGDDPTAAFYNPAATVALARPAAHFTYAKLFTGLEDVNLSVGEFAVVQPLKSFNVLTLGWGRVDAAGLRREDTLTVGAAHLFRGLNRVGDLSLGVSARYLSQSFTLDARTVDDPVFRDGRTRSDVAVDLHAHVASVDALSPNLAAGISFRALNRPDVGFSEPDRLPLEVVLGLRYRWRNLSFPLDLVERRGDVTPQGGIEAGFAEDKFALRLGTDTDQVGTGVGYRHALSDRLALTFDYAFLWPLKVQGSSGSHRATLGVRF